MLGGILGCFEFRLFMFTYTLFIQLHCAVHREKIKNRKAKKKTTELVGCNLYYWAAVAKEVEVWPLIGRLAVQSPAQ